MLTVDQLSTPPTVPNHRLPWTTVPAYKAGCIFIFYNEEIQTHTMARGGSTGAQEHEISFPSQLLSQLKGEKNAIDIGQGPERTGKRSTM
jgi:hypothetical protein